MSYHVSKNRVAGSLDEVPLGRLLDACRKNLITGTIAIDAGGMDGIVELRAGMPLEMRFGDLTGETALSGMRALRGGVYEVTQRLPDLTGELGGAAEGQGRLGDDITMARIMRLCENEALSCKITVVSDFDRAELVYRAGEIVGVFMNGRPDEDAIVDIAKYTGGRFKITAPPLPHDIDGWPSVAREPTAPFRIGHLAARPQPRRASSSAGLPGVGPVEQAGPKRALPLPSRPQVRNSDRRRIAVGTGPRSSLPAVVRARTATSEHSGGELPAQPPPTPVERPAARSAESDEVEPLSPPLGNSLRFRTATADGIEPDERSTSDFALATIVLAMVLSFAAVVWIAAAF